MKSILFLSHRWNDRRLCKHSSDMMMGLAFSRKGYDVNYLDYRDLRKEVGTNNLQKEIYNKIMDVRPDILFINKGEKVDPRTIIKTKQDGFKGVITGWYNDQRRSIVKCVMDAQSVSDIFFHCKAGPRLKEYEKKSGTPSYFLFAPYEPEFIKSVPFKDRTDNVSWFGQIYNPNNGWDNLRKDIIPKIRNKLTSYHACFNKGFIRGDEYYSALGNSKLSINIPAIDMSLYFSNRLSHVMGSGCVPMTYRFKDYEKIFTEGKNCISFKSPEEFTNVLNKYESELENISINSLKFANKYMKSDSVVEEILYVIENGQSNYDFMGVK